MALRVLFIARRFPPSIGGIQTHCHQLYTHLSEKCDIKLLALGRNSLVHLLWFIPYVIIKGTILCCRNSVDVIYLADGVTGFLAPFFKKLCKSKIVITVYGLEMTYKNAFARHLMVNGVRTADKVAVISENTRSTTLKLGVEPQKLKLIYVGVEPPEVSEERRKSLREKFQKEYNISFKEDRVLLNFGRLIPRKGVAAFLENGFGMLDNDIKLIIGGDGPDYQRICQIRENSAFKERIIILRNPSDEVIAMLRNSADLFVFPNIPYKNDIEGFGMTQLESMYSGMPVVAFAVDALVESVREGGYLIEPKNYRAFAEAIHNYFNLPEKKRAAKRQEAQSYVRREYNWEKTSSEYLKLFEN
ncbi:glycosyltransferase family 4 protein [Chitinispirillales bacterium ANBcel5]|uniref:glycosyltransferase family 4 protein n=1 Tax=Cellulosispirillum alkaliphilum TaxID=3039283 RepID=UPI002A537F1F|nr:glycosyltransferase family 4 protein [Chitinispirillales bacterium ANBcel5]